MKNNLDSYCFKEMKHARMTRAIRRRAYCIWIMRCATGPKAVRFYLATFLVWRIFSEVHLLRVLDNAPGLSNLPKNFVFFVRAFTFAEMSVKVYVAASLFLFAFVVRDIVRGHGLRHGRRYARV